MTVIFISLSCILGALIDSRLWGDKTKDRWWLIKYNDYIWLLGWGVQMFMGFTIGWFASGNYALLEYFLFMIACFLSAGVLWDMTFFKMESDVWVRPIRLWAKFGIPFFIVKDRKINSILSFEENCFVIGFNTVEDMILFNSFRILMLLSCMAYSLL